MYQQFDDLFTFYCSPTCHLTATLTCAWSTHRRSHEMAHTRSWPEVVRPHFCRRGKRLATSSCLRTESVSLPLRYRHLRPEMGRDRRLVHTRGTLVRRVLSSTTLGKLARTNTRKCQPEICGILFYTVCKYVLEDLGWLSWLFETLVPCVTAHYSIGIRFAIQITIRWIRDNVYVNNHTRHVISIKLY